MEHQLPKTSTATQEFPELSSEVGLIAGPVDSGHFSQDETLPFPFVLGGSTTPLGAAGMGSLPAVAAVAAGAAR